MYIKRYSIAAFILMVIVGWYVYAYVTHDSLSLSFFGLNLPSVSIALLVVVPLFLLYLASVLHMAFYSMLGGLKLRKYDKDYDKLVKALCDAFLFKENRSNEFKTQRYKTLGKVVDNSKIFPQTMELLGIENEKIKEVVTLIHKIQSGEVVNLKKLSLSLENPLVVQNNKNRYKTGELSAEEILINAKNHQREFVREVFVDFVQTAEGEKIMKYYKDFLSKEAFEKIVQRVAEEKEGTLLDVEQFVALFETLKETTKEEYLLYAKTLAKGMMPEARLQLFEQLSDKNDEATQAYLYTAFDLEMIDLADEILDASSPEEYKNFRAYKALKECNQNFNIDLFI